MVDIAKPRQLGFMDPDMLGLWRSMAPLPGGLILYGGTALALYLNHRNSTDFNFATSQACISGAFVRSFPWLAGAKIDGGSGMVDATYRTEGLEIKLTFMECGHLIPYPTRKPLLASNEVAVAHPVDLLAAKYEACLGRGALRDYADLAAAFDTWPSLAKLAAHILPGRHPAAVGRAIASPPLKVEHYLSDKQLGSLHLFSRVLARTEKGVEW
ncbi:MAG: nucleotidyl transferase AbiEii/AbiGii toxin family protein [Gammaproteobacteria bacterium]|nr:nucleotidyl transferase AbiEii/AbiGii toxin family protein [Gammaproteobacteria bacterium]